MQRNAEKEIQKKSEKNKQPAEAEVYVQQSGKG